jgi:hypothetical protein
VGAGTRLTTPLLAVFFTAGVVLALATASLRLCLVGVLVFLLHFLFVHNVSPLKAFAFVISLPRCLLFMRKNPGKVCQITCEKGQKRVE